MKRHANLFFGSTLLALDMAMTCVAFYFAHILRGLDASPRQGIPPFRYYLGMMLLNVAAIVVVFFFYKLLEDLEAFPSNVFLSSPLC